MISCPSDVKTEVEIIERVVANINDSIGLSMDIFIKTLHWSKNVMPEAGDYPQSIINKQILDKSDAIVAIFGNKVGSPTNNYDSGTIEEIEKMIEKGKQVFIYFSDKPVRKSEIDMKSERKIQNFKKKYQDRGIYAIYNSDEEFNNIVSKHLTRYLTTEIVNEANSIEEHTRFDDSILTNTEVDLIYDYTRFYEIKSVVSCADTKMVKLTVHKDCFEMDIDISSLGKTDKQEFAMALFEYAPCDNWLGFFEAGYFLEFDMVSCGAIQAFQLEIEDDIRNKVINKATKVTNKGEHFQLWLPSSTRDSTAWKKVAQVCFIVFFNDSYMVGKNGKLTIENLKMIPKN
jgi:nucleoside 2-deoxyribosyltransferase